MATEIKRSIPEIGEILTLGIKATWEDHERFGYGVVTAILWLVGKISTETLKAQLEPSKHN